jgi:hypothetical protein
MNGKQIGLGLVLVDFVALTAYAVYHHGYQAFFDFGAMNAIQIQMIQIFIDLIIALSIVVGWMWRDAKARGISPMPYIVMTLFLGSIGPLVYLIRREAADASPIAATAVPRSA